MLSECFRNMMKVEFSIQPKIYFFPVFISSVNSFKLSQALISILLVTCIILHIYSNQMDCLCQELLCHIFAFIPTHSRLALALVCKSWAAAVADCRSLTLLATPKMASVGLDKILSRFHCLQSLFLKLIDNTDEMMHALVSLGSSFSGHDSIRYIHSDTSSVIYGLSRSPQLERLVMQEGFSMPIPHMLSMKDNGLEMVFVQLACTLKYLEIDCPLLWAIYRFSELNRCFRHANVNQIELPSDDDDSSDDDNATVITHNSDDSFLLSNQNVSALSDEDPSKSILCTSCPQEPAITKLTIKSLHTSSFRDFFRGWIGCQKLNALVYLHLSTDEVSISSKHMAILSNSAPNLQSLVLTNCNIRSDNITNFVCALPPTITLLHLLSCNIQIGPVLSVTTNIAQALVLCITQVLENLENLEINHCRLAYDEAAFINATILASNNHMAAVNALKNIKPKLKHLTLLGFGRQMPDVRFILQFPLVTLKLDDISPSLIESALPFAGMNMESRQETGSTSQAESTNELASLTWLELCQHLPNLVDLDLRCTRISANLQRARDSDLAYESRTPSVKAIASLTQLKYLSIYAPSSIPAVCYILDSQPGLQELKLNYIPCDGYLYPQEKLLNLAQLNSLSLHSHGNDSAYIIQILALLITPKSPKLSSIHLSSTKPMLKSHHTNDVYDINADNWISITNSPKKSLQTDTSAFEMSCSTLRSMLSQCRCLKSLKLVGFKIDPDALVWMSTPIDLNCSINPYSYYLETLEFTLPEPSIPIVFTLLEGLPNLTEFNMCVESIDQSLRSYTVGCEHATSDTLLSNSEPTTSASTTRQSATETTYRYHQNNSFTDRMYSTDNVLPSVVVTSTIGTQTSLSSDDDNRTEIDSNASISTESVSSFEDNEDYDEWRELFCNTFTKNLKATAWWLSKCKVWTHNRKQQQSRMTIIRRILTARRQQFIDNQSQEASVNGAENNSDL
ncbi:hypothetical protein QVD99_008134 [Batrachochytrium dendrobatidis]|nr:hypothetical protein QVD99_008134 [Batrachochytrium dendrobatidis]